MAGNPYTESGEKFQIPDMLASRADTYNLGDVIGSNNDSFELSYLENCLTSNSTLARLNSRSRNDVYSVIKMATADNPQGQTLEGSYSIEEINEFVGVMKKLLVARDVILKVNREYISSAAQSDDYRTEPAFKLQGSYRDMNNIAEQVSAIMNDEELDTLINAHYLNQAQTLTSGAQANLLKLQDLTGTLAGEDLERWNDIKRTFQRNLMLGAAGGDSELGQVIAQLSTFSDGLGKIQTTLDKGVTRLVSAQEEEPSAFEKVSMQQVSHAVVELAKFNASLADVKSIVADMQQDRDPNQPDSASKVARDAAAVAPAPVQQKIEVINKVPPIFLEVIRNQFRILQTWMEPILALAESLPEADGFKQAMSATAQNYDEFFEKVVMAESVEEDKEKKKPAKPKNTGGRKKSSKKKPRGKGNKGKQ